jgi:hypothetical protein
MGNSFLQKVVDGQKADDIRVPTPVQSEKSRRQHRPPAKGIILYILFVGCENRAS